MKRGGDPVSKGDFKSRGSRKSHDLSVRFGPGQAARNRSSRATTVSKRCTSTSLPVFCFLYLIKIHTYTLQLLNFAVQEKKELIAIFGEVGCGKTAPCCRFRNEHDPARPGDRQPAASHLLHGLQTRNCSI